VKCSLGLPSVRVDDDGVDQGAEIGATLLCEARRDLLGSLLDVIVVSIELLLLVDRSGHSS